MSKNEQHVGIVVDTYVGENGDKKDKLDIGFLLTDGPHFILVTKKGCEMPSSFPQIDVGKNPSLEEKNIQTDDYSIKIWSLKNPKSPFK
jgi:hypothetical protein